ncbi:hypothetical protein NCAS_0J00570 [Naumovozyma castellii]|uniref:Uncharacterized protein n=1 Tax=Naumovozyma castellii TaxID=27288 RepID=G0VKJ9_NAUCA|nr:hypothetical protein NCAS_0J00570 [Naumovozyma castellii CBS 4309]CCC72036.1 hypothetical protein NCAS_0J00570 [Naumovozyma castellii CBS 4309]
MGILAKALMRTLKAGNEDLHVDMSSTKKVPEKFQFCTERTMPMVRLWNRGGYFLFSSRQSLDKFKADGGSAKFVATNKEGVGIPLFHITREVIELVPSFNMYKYEIISADDPPIYSNHAELVSDNGKFKLYKIPFCKISTTVNATRIEHHFNYFTVKEFNNSLIRQPMFRDMDTEIESSLLRWHTNYTPVLTNTHYSLELLPQKMPSLYDDKSVTVRNKLIGEPVYDKFVVGHLTSDTSDLMPRTTFKVAKLIVGETTETDSLGISDIPLTTQIIACQSMLIYYVDELKDTERSRRRTGRQRLNTNQIIF